MKVQTSFTNIFLIFCFLRLDKSLAQTENEIKEPAVFESEVRSVMSYLEHLTHFYEPTGILAIKTLQERTKDLNEGAETLRQMEKLVQKMEKDVDMIVKESVEKRKEDTAAVVKFFQSRFVSIVQGEVKESEKKLLEHFTKVDSFRSRLNGYVSEGAKQKKMLDTLLELAVQAKMPTTESKDDQKTEKSNKMEAEREYQRAAVYVFRLFANAFKDVNFDLSAGFETLKNDHKDHPGLVKIIGELFPGWVQEFQKQESKEGKFDWIAGKLRAVFTGRLINNVNQSIIRTNELSAEAQKKLTTGLQSYRKRYESTMKKMKVEETLLGEEVIKSFKLEL